MLEIVVEDFVQPHDVYCINSKIKKGTGWDTGNRMFWAKKLRDQTCVATRIAEYYVKPENTAVYLVTVPDIEGFFKTDWITTLPEATVAKLKQYNMPILLSQPDEYFVRYDREQIERFDRALASRGLAANTVITHSINVSYDDTKSIAVGDRQIINFFSYGWLNTTAINKFENKDTVERDRDYLCINRTMRDIRSIFYLNYLQRQDNAYVSFIAEYAGKPITPQHLLNYKFSLSVQYLEEPLKSLVSEQIGHAPSTVPCFLDSEENQQVKGISNKDLEYYRKKVWFEIVTETHDIDHDSRDIAILTEKSLYPIAAGIPFLVLGHRKIYQLLEDLGFKLYDFDYDPDTDITERFNQLNRFLDRFKSWDTEQRQQWLDQQQDRIEYNQRLLFDTDWIQLESDLLAALLAVPQQSGT